MKRWLLILICLPSLAFAAQSRKPTPKPKSSQAAKSTKPTAKKAVAKGLEEVHKLNRNPPGNTQAKDCAFITPPVKPEAFMDAPVAPEKENFKCEDEKLSPFYAVKEKPAAEMMSTSSESPYAKCIQIAQKPNFASYKQSYCTSYLRNRNNTRLDTESSNPCPTDIHTSFAANTFSTVMDCMKVAPARLAGDKLIEIELKLKEAERTLKEKLAETNGKAPTPAQKQALENEKKQIESDRKKYERERKIVKILYLDQPLKEEHLIPLFAQESGFHYSSVSETKAAGFGQLTDSAIDQVNSAYRAKYLAAFKKPSLPKSCGKLAQLLEKDLPSEPERRCEVIAPPNRAVQNMLYAVIYFEETRKVAASFLLDKASVSTPNRVTQHLKDGAKSGDKEWATPTLARRLTYLFYNSGPGAGVSLANDFLYAKAKSKKQPMALADWVKLLPGSKSGEPEKYIPGIVQKADFLNSQVEGPPKCAEY